jgi:hypothetical protein
MAIDRSASKSGAIGEYLAANPGSSPARIVAALKEQGIVVSESLAKVVKYGKPKKKTARKKQTRRRVAGRTAGKPSVSSSELIRGFISRNPRATPKVIAAGLKAEGVSVSMSLISAVKYRRRTKTGTRKARRRASATHVAAPAKATSAPSIAQLIEVKRFANTMGGADRVRQALEMLEQLQ